MSGCAAVGCSNRGDKGFFMKSFPRDPDRRALWASQMKRDRWQPNNNSRICEVHFDNDQWERTRQDGTRKLKCNAVPTLFEFSKQKLRRKGRKLKFIVPFKADVPSPLNVFSKDKSESSTNFGKLFENPENRNVTTDEENRHLSYVESKIKSEIDEKLMNFEAESISDGRAEPKTILQNENINPSTSRNRLFNNTKKLSSFSTDVKRDGNLLFKDTAIPDLYNSDDCDEARIMDLEDETESKACEGSELSRCKKFSDNLDNVGIIKLKDICCRLCARSNGKNYIPIFGESDLAEKISRCLPIIVLPTDNLPLYVCQLCLYHLNITYKLILGSLRADSILRSEFVEANESQGFKQPIETPYEELGANKSEAKDEPVFKINGPIECDLCDVLFRDMNLFDTHIETTHLLQWRCSLCDHSFETSQELLAHKTLNHLGHISTCETCMDCNSLEKLDPKVPEVVVKDRNTDVASSLDRLLDEDSKAEELAEKLENLSCTKCKIVFDEAKQFRKHHTIHLPRHIKCSLCCKRCPSLFDYITHTRIVHNQIKRSNLGKRNNLHSCKYCKKVFLIKQQLIVHLRKHKKEMLDDPSVTVYKCVTCPKKFVDRALYQKHRNVHDPACWHKFRCYICNRSFMDKFKLKIHQSIHDGVKPYQCDVCGRMFNRNANMTRHRAKHFEQTCRHCQRVFKNTQSLREHLKDIHADTLTPKSNCKTTRAGKGDGNKTNASGDNFICGYCGKQVTSYYSLLDHERIHTGDKPYVCQHCGKAFRSITARWDHMVRHEKGNYICELCGKIMSNKLNLRRHLRKHAAIEQRRFECKECGKLFHVKWRLNAHLMRIHHSGPRD